jgi:hypothetical protein
MQVGLRASLNKLALAISLMLTLSSVRPAMAESTTTLLDNLAKSSEFQVRTAAAISLGNAKDRSTRPALETALASDPHPAVRGAAAAALGALGDPAAVSALDRAARQDDSSSVRSVAATASQKLASGSASAAKVKVLVQLGAMKNSSSVTERDLTVALRDATRAEVSRIPGVEVLAEGADAKATASSRKLPVIILDGTITKMDSGSSNGMSTMSASIDFVIKKDSSLKGTTSGGAQSQAPPPSSTTSAALKAVFVRDLQDQALTGAVQGAFKNTSAALVKAAM